MYVEGDSGSARPWAEEGPQRGSSGWKTPWWASLGVPRWGSTKQLFWTLQDPCLVSPGLSSLRLPASVSGLLGDTLISSAFPFSSRLSLSLRPVLSAPACVLGPVAWACRWQWDSQGAETRPLPENRQQREAGLRHVGAWLADHKSWKCLTR